MRVLNKLAILAAAATLSACVGSSKPDAVEPTVNAAQTAVPSAENIAYVTLDLPKQLPLAIVKQNSSPEGSLYAQWNIKDQDDVRSPVRIIYQRIQPAVDARKLQSQVLYPFTKKCSDIKVTPFQLATKHNPKLAAELICAHQQKSNYGSLVQVGILTDALANHLIFTEVKTIPSVTAGQLVAKNDQEKQQVQESTQLIGLMQQLIQSVKACDQQKNCN